MERAGEAAGLARAVDHPHAAVAAGVDHRLHLAVGVAGQQDGRAAQVDGAVAARARERAGEAEHERLAVEQDLELVVVALG